MSLEMVKEIKIREKELIMTIEEKNILISESQYFLKSLKYRVKYIISMVFIVLLSLLLRLMYNSLFGVMFCIIAIFNSKESTDMVYKARE